jgi:hypothetical protein
MPSTPRTSHQRSTAAVVLTRHDSRPLDPPTRVPAPPPRRARRWPTMLIWLLLAGAIAGLWALLLLGDSLSVSG